MWEDGVGVGGSSSPELTWSIDTPFNCLFQGEMHRTQTKTGSIRSYAPGSNKDGGGSSPAGVSLET